MKEHITLALLLTGAVVGMTEAAQTFPDHPVRLVVPFSPGGGTDILARPLAEALAKKWGQSVVVENKGGARGSIGTDAAAKARPDGYTLVLGTVGTHAINQSLYSKLPYDGVRDFEAITLMANTPNILVVSPKAPATGEPETPLSRAQIDQKFERLASQVFGRSARRINEAVSEIELVRGLSLFNQLLAVA